MTDSR